MLVLRPHRIGVISPSLMQERVAWTRSHWDSTLWLAFLMHTSNACVAVKTIPLSSQPPLTHGCVDNWPSPWLANTLIKYREDHTLIVPSITNPCECRQWVLMVAYKRTDYNEDLAFSHPWGGCGCPAPSHQGQHTHASHIGKIITWNRLPVMGSQRTSAHVIILCRRRSLTHLSPH